MTIEPLVQQDILYVILGIDENQHDQVVAIFRTFREAKEFCVSALTMQGFFDVWIEKHPLQ